MHAHRATVRRQPVAVLLPGLFGLVSGALVIAPTPENVFHFADGRELHVPATKRPQIEIVRHIRRDYLSYACGDGYRISFFALESVEVSAERDAATYRELVS